MASDAANRVPRTKQHGIAWLNPGDKIDGVFRRGETLNMITGCTPCSPGCLNCYARSLHDKRHKAYLAGKLQSCPQYSTPFEEVRFWPERLKKLASWKEPRMVFIGSMCDVFHEDVPSLAMCEILGACCRCERHTLIMLTKRPERMRGWLDSIGLDKVHKNWWLGVTVCNQQEADEKIPILLQIPAAKRFVSSEPLLEPLDLSAYLSELNWVIAGCESGPNARFCGYEWIQPIVNQCDKVGTACFVKQLPKGWGDFDNWPLSLQVRQWPEVQP
jgi:protein gp37